jgi:hypothetical protein
MTEQEIQVLAERIEKAMSDMCLFDGPYSDWGRKEVIKIVSQEIKDFLHKDK